MQRPYNDRWERTRRHLLRNLFDYQGELSPVLEEAESDGSDDRPYSPLPELIVEREPNRHDHSDEYYQQLEVRMRRYYQRLFIDGGSNYEAFVDDFEEIPDFVIGKSNTNTCITDKHNYIEEESHKSVADGTREEIDSIINDDEMSETSKSTDMDSSLLSVVNKSDPNNIPNDKEILSEIQEFSQDISTPSDMVINLDEFEVEETLNENEAPQTADKHASKSIETESDIVEACHVISSTVAEVYSELERVKAPRIFEDGSPVLMPKARELSKRVFGNISLSARNIMNSIHDVEKEAKDDEGKEKETQPVSNEIEGLHKSGKRKNYDLDVEWLTPNDTHQFPSKESQETVENCEEEETFGGTGRNQTPDSKLMTLNEYNDKNQKVLNDDSASPLRTSESDETKQTQNEESIGPNEFDYYLSDTSRLMENHDEKISEHTGNSFEMALRKGLFETKNARKNFSSSSECDDVSYESEDFEPVEVMRGTMQTRLTDSIRRESTLSKDSPLVRTAIQATAEEIEEDDFESEDYQVKASDPEPMAARDEGDERPLEIEQTTSHDSSSTDANGNDDAAEFSSLGVLEHGTANKHGSSDNADASTPFLARIRSIADISDDIWSVSPMNINFEELPPKEYVVNTSRGKTDSNWKKRRLDPDLNIPVKKRKRYNNIDVQTSTSRQLSANGTANGDDAKHNFLVGKPLVFRLCKCRDHVCL